MNRSPSRRGLVALVALLLGAGGVFTIVRYVQMAEERAMAGQELVDVFVVVEEVEAGTSATVIAESVEVQQVPVAYRADDAVTSLDALGDLAATAPLVPGEQLLTSRFAPARARTVAGGATAVPDGLLEVTIETSPERGVGAQVQPGEFVAVVATFDAFTQETETQTTAEAEGVAGAVEVGQPQTHFLLRKVLVTNVQTQAAAPLSDDEESERSRTLPSGTLLVTLAVEPGQVERLVFAGEFGTLWLARDEALAPEESTPIVSYDNIFTGDLFGDTEGSGSGTADPNQPTEPADQADPPADPPPDTDDPEPTSSETADPPASLADTGTEADPAGDPAADTGADGEEG